MIVLPFLNVPVNNHPAVPIPRIVKVSPITEVPESTVNVDAALKYTGFEAAAIVQYILLAPPAIVISPAPPAADTPIFHS